MRGIFAAAEGTCTRRGKILCRGHASSRKKIEKNKKDLTEKARKHPRFFNIETAYAPRLIALTEVTTVSRTNANITMQTNNTLKFKIGHEMN